jgi:hypothetical protein
MFHTRQAFAHDLARQQVLGIVAALVDHAAHQVAVSVERAVADFAHAQRVEGEVAAVGRQAGLEAGDSLPPLSR